MHPSCLQVLWARLTAPTATQQCTFLYFIAETLLGLTKHSLANSKSGLEDDERLYIDGLRPKRRTSIAVYAYHDVHVRSALCVAKPMSLLLGAVHWHSENFRKFGYFFQEPF